MSTFLRIRFAGVAGIAHSGLPKYGQSYANHLRVELPKHPLFQHASSDLKTLELVCQSSRPGEGYGQFAFDTPILL